MCWITKPYSCSWTSSIMINSISQLWLQKQTPLYLCSILRHIQETVTLGHVSYGSCRWAAAAPLEVVALLVLRPTLKEQPNLGYAALVADGKSKRAVRNSRCLYNSCSKLVPCHFCSLGHQVRRLSLTQWGGIPACCKSPSHDRMCNPLIESGWRAENNSTVCHRQHHFTVRKGH